MGEIQFQAQVSSSTATIAGLNFPKYLKSVQLPHEKNRDGGVKRFARNCLEHFDKAQRKLCRGTGMAND